jgi:hypothetical protein
MPAWTLDYLGVRVANVVPGDAERGLAAVTASHMLSCAAPGSSSPSSKAAS